MLAKNEKAKLPASVPELLAGDRLRQMAERLELDGGAPISDRTLGFNVRWNVEGGRPLSIKDAQRLRAAHDRRRREVAFLAALWGVR